MLFRPALPSPEEDIAKLVIAFMGLFLPLGTGLNFIGSGYNVTDDLGVLQKVLDDTSCPWAD